MSTTSSRPVSARRQETLPRVLSFGDGTLTACLGGETKTLRFGESISGWQLVAFRG